MPPPTAAATAASADIVGGRMHHLILCEFPYEAQLPVKTENGYETREFKSQDDVWAVIDLIAQETKEFNET